MKRFILCACVSLAFFGCNYWTEHNFEIKNSSSQTVSFSINNYGDDVYTLKSNENITLKLYDHPKFTMKDNPRLFYKSSVSSATFYDMEKYTFEISNNCFHEITISEKNGLLTDTYKGTETIPAATATQNGNSYTPVAGKKTVVVYNTTTPSFEAHYSDGNGEVDATSFITYKKID